MKTFENSFLQIQKTDSGLIEIHTSYSSVETFLMNGFFRLIITFNDRNKVLNETYKSFIQSTSLASAPLSFQSNMIRF